MDSIAHVAELRELVKEAEDFAKRLSHLASTIEHQSRIPSTPVKEQPNDKSVQGL